MKKGFFLFALLIINLPLLADTNRYVVYFTDKDQSNYSISRPEEFLSSKAIERRLNQDIPVTQKDLPVNHSYLAEVEKVGAKVFYTSKWFNAALVEVEDMLLEKINELPFIQKVEYVAPIRGNFSKNTFESLNSIKLRLRKNKSSMSTADQNQMLGVDVMHREGFTGEGILIAVFDGGFEKANELPFFDHLKNSNKVISTYNYVTHETDIFKFDDHGTKALSCIAAFQPDVLVGTAYNADFILCLTEDVYSEYRVEEFNWLFAAEFADSAGVDIISTSLGYSNFTDNSMNYSYEDLDGKTTVITKAANFATEAGILVIVSAGNSGTSSEKFITAPADAPGVLSVGAINRGLEKAGFSSIGPTSDGRIKPEVMALGVGTTVGGSDGNITFASGTSFAAPLITGLAAGFWQANPQLKVSEVAEYLKKSGTNVVNPDNLMGFGIPNYTKAQHYVNFSRSQGTNFRIFPNPIQDQRLYLQVRQKSEEVTPPFYQLFNQSGQLLHSDYSRQTGSNDLFFLDLPVLIPGIYYLLWPESTVLSSLKFIKQ